MWSILDGWSFGTFTAYFLYLLLGTHLVFLFFYCYLIWNCNYWRNRGIPTALPVTLLGTYPSIFTQSRNIIFDIQDVYKRYKNANRVVGVFVTRRPEVLVLDPKLAHEILVDDFKKFSKNLTGTWVYDPSVDKYVVRNPFWSSGKEWKKQRLHAMGGLTVRRLKNCHKIWKFSCFKLVNIIENRISCGRSIMDVRDLINRYSADVMFDFIWGLDACSLSKQNESNIFMKMTETWLTHTYKARKYSLMLLPLAPFLRCIFRYKLFPVETDKFFADVTQRAIDLRTNFPNPEREDFLNYLISLQKTNEITFDDMVGYCLIILLDGYETTGLTIMHCLFYLAKYQVVQKKARKEIQDALQTNGEIDFDELQNLKYLDQCIYETLRLFTLLPYFSRVCTESTTIDLNNGKTVQIDEGTVVTVPVFSYHRDSTYFDNPQRFYPERFSNNAHLQFIKNGTFLPFGDGPRMCLGFRVAMVTIKMVLVEILSRFDVNQCDATPLECAPRGTHFVASLEGDIMLEFSNIVDDKI